MSGTSCEGMATRRSRAGYSRGIAGRYSEDRYSEDRWKKALTKKVHDHRAEYLEPHCGFTLAKVRATHSLPSEPTPDVPVVLRVPPLAYLKTIAVLAWSAFRHPGATTTVDLFTGDVMNRT